MGKLEDLVPSLELCKQIPEGAFVDSALVWNTTICDEDDGEICGVHERDDCESWMRENQIPAPTLEEIGKELIKQSVTRRIVVSLIHGEWGVSGQNSRASYSAGDSAATAALRLWLEVKGIK